MKFWDYMILDHIADKSAWRTARNIEKAMERREKTKEEAKKNTEATLAMLAAAPIATVTMFLSVVCFFFSFGHPVARWICVFIFVYSLFVVFHSMTSPVRKAKCYALLAPAAAVAWTGLYVFFSVGRLGVGFALAIVGFILAVVISSVFSPASYSPDSSATSGGSESADRTKSASPQE